MSVTEGVRQVLELFARLPESDKQPAVVEILRRFPPGEIDLSLHALDALAEELFIAIDREEAAA